MDFPFPFKPRAGIILALVFLVIPIFCTGCVSRTAVGHLHPQWAYPIYRPNPIFGASGTSGQSRPVAGDPVGRAEKRVRIQSSGSH